jgi:hypothetical protein
MTVTEIVYFAIYFKLHASALAMTVDHFLTPVSSTKLKVS